MEPLSLIVAALVGGAAAAAKDVGTQAVKDGYEALKRLALARLGGKGPGAAVLEQVERKPGSEAWQSVLREELAESGASDDGDLLSQARALLDLLGSGGPGGSYTANLTGSGAIAQGPGAKAAGEGGVVVEGDVEGGIRTGRTR
jgi:hypothetical protein